MATTYQLIADTTLGSAGTITFNSISQSYQDLVVRIYLAGAGSVNDFAPYGPGGSFFGSIFRGSDAGTASGGPFTSNYNYVPTAIPQNSDTNAWAFQEIYIANYANTTYPKMWHTNGGWTNVGTGSRVSVNWSGYNNSTTAGLSSIIIAGDGVSNLRAGSRATVYGIAK